MAGPYSLAFFSVCDNAQHGKLCTLKVFVAELTTLFWLGLSRLLSQVGVASEAFEHMAISNRLRNRGLGVSIIMEVDCRLAVNHDI